MQVNIYYGGRGLIEDSTIYVMNKITEVLDELRVKVVRYNLYEEKNGITMLPKTLKEADGVILATTVEWLGIGGYMQQFLDACWLYGDKDHLSKLYMMPVVTASAYGEREAELTLVKSWEILGGIPYEGIATYVEDHVDFETNLAYSQIIEKKAELADMYEEMSRRMIESIKNIDIDKINAYQRVIAASACTDKMRLLRGESTNNEKVVILSVPRTLEQYQEILRLQKQQGEEE